MPRPNSVVAADVEFEPGCAFMSNIFTVLQTSPSFEVDAPVAVRGFRSGAGSLLMLRDAALRGFAQHTEHRAATYRVDDLAFDDLGCVTLQVAMGMVGMKARDSWRQLGELGRRVYPFGAPRRASNESLVQSVVRFSSDPTPSVR